MTTPAPGLAGRAEHLARLAADAFDVLVIGGGISGAAVARDAARRGFRTGLIEARDFAQGTSSRSSRLVHGGLRYLEHFELDLVFEASQERRTLLRIAPHLVRPLEFLFPIFDTGRVGKRKLDAGLWLYDALSLFRNIERHQMLERGELIAREPRLRVEGLLGGARYFDAQVDDARLVVTTVIAAAEAGAAVANRCEAVEIETDDWPGHRVIARDHEGGADVAIDALCVVNATGPWSGCTLARTGVERPVRLAPSRGTHIHVPRRRVGHEHAFIFEAPADHRIMFVLPWREDLTLIGTTDVFHPGSPDSVAATGEDIRYLLDATNHLFPDAHLGPDDVLSAWAGLRPLLAPPPGPDGPGGTDATDPAGGKGAGAVSREFEIREEPHGVFSLLGGKLTSHRNMAEETVDRAARFLEEVEVYGDDCDTARVPLPGGDFESLDDLREALVVEAGKAGVSRAGAARLARAYGTRSSAVLDVVRDRPQLAGPIADGRPHVLAEAAYAVRREYALRLEDILYRRTRIGLETRDGVETAARRVAAVVGPELGWDRERTAREIERCLEHRSADDAAIEEARDGAGEHVAGDHVAGDHRAGDHRAGDQETPTGGTE